MQSKIFFILLCLLFSVLTTSFAFTLELQNVPLTDALRLTAKSLKHNLILSPAIEGDVTVNLQGITAEDALDLLLTAYGLAKWSKGNSWFIAPHAELMKRKQEIADWSNLNKASMPLETKVFRMKYAKADELTKVLKNEHTDLLSKRGSIHIDKRTNIIFIHDIAEKVDGISALIHALDIPVKQIQIEARLASVDHDFERELGIRFETNALSKESATEHIQPSVGKYSLAIAKLVDSTLLDVKLAALENAGHATLISSPSLLTANQQTASIEAGEEIPYQEVSESGGTAVVFKKAVLALKVTPHLLPNQQVLLQLQVNQDRPSSKMVQGVPMISTRQLSTNVLVKNGQTIVLGGIYESNYEHGEQGLPFISRIPLLGWLFKQQNLRENKRELLIFVTPKLITI